jgi:NNP family nitrate/nitrite transporter-like MFS transporter
VALAKADFNMNNVNTVSALQQTRALSLSTIAFAASFAVWTIFSIIGVQIQRDLNLSETEFGLLVGTPILTGALARLPLGIWTDQYGGRIVYPLVMLASAAATWLMTLAHSYVMFLVAALGMGVAGGTFAVGVAYVSKWYPQGRQGTALGVFGSGNVGSAATAFIAPFVMVAYGWQTVAQIWATALAVMALVFWFTAQDDPSLRERRLASARPKSFIELLEPLTKLQIWRFSLYYFFTFGAFVALALWLPRYLIGAYGMDIRTAGMVAAAYLITASLCRAIGGWLSDRYGARTIMYWAFGVSMAVTFLLSYPPTQYAVQGIREEIRFSMSMGVGAFIVLMFVLGFFMALGNAAVFKHIPTYYPKNVGAIGGVVGMIGGLGGFLLPITFGMMNDLTGIWQSCFVLLFVQVSIMLVWMHFAIMRMERRVVPQLAAVPRDLPELVHDPRLVFTEWNPEDPRFWEEKGKRIAYRNLWISIPALFLAFAVWEVWSVIVVKLPEVGFNYSSNQLFWLAALPGLSGATLRIFYSFVVPVFGGRRWTIISTASLLVPCVWIGFAVQNPQTPYVLMLILALLSGLGGGNFASSMANINYFFPKAHKGTALGLNAGLGNLGVSAVQFLVPLVITFPLLLGGEPQVLAQAGATQQVWLQNAGFIWVGLVLAAAIAAWFGMNDIQSGQASFKDQTVIFKRKHNWIMCWLYLGTYGSFIGYSAGFPMLIRAQFPDLDPMQYAFLGPLVGAIARPIGGWISDKLGGARVTFWTFVLMAGAVAGVLYFMPQGGAGGNFAGFFAMFMLLFTLVGIGSGSTYGMISIIFLNQRQREAAGKGKEADVQAVKKGNTEAGAVLGFASAFGAFGGFYIPMSYGTSISTTGGPEAALYLFIVFYLICIVTTWWFYSRNNAEMRC